MKGKIIRFLPGTGTGIIMVHVNGENGKEFQHLQFNKQHYDDSISKHIYKDQEVEVSLKKVGHLYLVEHINYDIGRHLYRKTIYSNESSPTDIQNSSRNRGRNWESSQHFSREGYIKDSRYSNKRRNRRNPSPYEHSNNDDSFKKPVSDIQKTSNVPSSKKWERQKHSSYNRKNFSPSSQGHESQQGNNGSRTSYNKKDSSYRRKSQPMHNRFPNRAQNTKDNPVTDRSISDNISSQAEPNSRIIQNKYNRQYSNRYSRNESRSKPRQRTHSYENKDRIYHEQGHIGNHGSSQRNDTRPSNDRRSDNRYDNRRRYNKRQSQRYPRNGYKSRRYQYRMRQQRLAIYLHYKRIKQRKQIFLLRVLQLKKLKYRRKRSNIH